MAIQARIMFQGYDIMLVSNKSDDGLEHRLAGKNCRLGPQQIRLLSNFMKGRHNLL